MSGVFTKMLADAAESVRPVVTSPREKVASDGVPRVRSPSVSPELDRRQKLLAMRTKHQVRKEKSDAAIVDIKIDTAAIQQRSTALSASPDDSTKSEFSSPVAVANSGPPSANTKIVNIESVTSSDNDNGKTSRANDTVKKSIAGDTAVVSNKSIADSVKNLHSSPAANKKPAENLNNLNSVNNLKSSNDAVKSGTKDIVSEPVTISNHISVATNSVTPVDNPKQKEEILLSDSQVLKKELSSLVICSMTVVLIPKIDSEGVVASMTRKGYTFIDVCLLASDAGSIKIAIKMGPYSGSIVSGFGVATVDSTLATTLLSLGHQQAHVSFNYEDSTTAEEYLYVRKSSTDKHPPFFNGIKVIEDGAEDEIEAEKIGFIKSPFPISMTNSSKRKSIWYYSEPNLLWIRSLAVERDALLMALIDHQSQSKETSSHSASQQSQITTLEARVGRLLLDIEAKDLLHEEYLRNLSDGSGKMLKSLEDKIRGLEEQNLALSQRARGIHLLKQGDDNTFIFDEISDSEDSFDLGLIIDDEERMAKIQDKEMKAKQMSSENERRRSLRRTYEEMDLNIDDDSNVILAFATKCLKDAEAMKRQIGLRVMRSLMDQWRGGGLKRAFYIWSGYASCSSLFIATPTEFEKALYENKLYRDYILTLENSILAMETEQSNHIGNQLAAYYSTNSVTMPGGFTGPLQQVVTSGSFRSGSGGEAVQRQQSITSLQKSPSFRAGEGFQRSPSIKSASSFQSSSNSGEGGLQRQTSKTSLKSIPLLQGSPSTSAASFPRSPSSNRIK